ncbi:type IV pili methyl-accepting chemotaxis transducer N-terminal domain-containing protein, partial [Klebsiella pneumoniae]|uniref:type IV pili methyl-accepting chemotaxis transducer N-terminal domain-containing protein n=1 Tax=Klebsiella pneumoniae TaxID=573 RepID=UPI0023F8D545|nr:type IV pili methyl-accepting chemotaxis transducer N-terminal domain-containing protein [Klebsiella pneumoniae]
MAIIHTARRGLALFLRRRTHHVAGQNDIGVAGMAISARLVNGVQGSAHAINKAGSLRMQSYRLLAA